MRTWIKYILPYVFALPVVGPVAGQQLHADFRTHALSGNNEILSLTVYIRDDNAEIRTTVSGTFAISAQGASLQADSVRINKGVGSLTTEVIKEGGFNLSLPGFQGEGQVKVNDLQPVQEVNGQLTGNTTWSAEQDYLITDDLVIPAGSSLVIQEGTSVLLGEKVNVFVYGGLKVEGTAENMVRFGPADPGLPWGGIQLNSVPDSVIFEHCFFVLGGNDEDYIFGHSQSQPVVKMNGTLARFSHCFFMDNPGKAMGGAESRVKIKDCVITRCDTGGEYHGCDVEIASTWYAEIPDGDGIIEDDDNDAVYIGPNHPQTQGPSTVKDCYFITGEDDGIDHLDANLHVSNCWVEGFYHEGIATSEGHAVKIYNSLFMNCEQGIEAGFGEPQVEVDHCTVVDNVNGIRFGDSYPWGCGGHISVTNSILYNNSDNVLNYDMLTQGPVAGAIEIAYTMTNDPEYDNGPGCVTGTPEFDEFYLLMPGSFGTGLAMDGSDLGLINPGTAVFQQEEINSLNVFPNPFTERFSVSLPLASAGEEIRVRVFDGMGHMNYNAVCRGREDQAGEITIPAGNWAKGVYCVIVTAGSSMLMYNKIIKTDH